tara:strand:- start:183 stop:371 length:189 start_codon:yes stop_codon:yes gene_type:complete
VNVVTEAAISMKTVKAAPLTVVNAANAQMAKSLTVMAAMNAGPKAGLVMVSQIVMISSMVLT